MCEGFPDLPGLLQTMAYGRVFAMHCPCPATGKPFFEYNLMTEGYFTFMRCIHMDISACLYNGALTLTPLEVRPLYYYILLFQCHYIMFL